MLNCFFDPFVNEIRAYERSNKKDYLNLSNNEFFHQDQINLFKQINDAVFIPSIINQYPYIRDAEDIIAKKLDVSSNSIVLCPGSDMVIRAIIHSLGKQAKAVYLQWPNYNGYEYYGKLFKVKMERLVTGFEDVDSLCRKISQVLAVAKDSLLFLTNPSGVNKIKFSIDRIAGFLEVAQKNNTLIAIDEAYTPFDMYNHLGLLKQYKELLLIRSFSKAYGMAGIRLGCIIGQPEIIGYLRKWNMLSAISGYTVAFFKELLKYDSQLTQMRQEVMDLKKQILQTLTVKKITVGFHEGYGPFLFLKFPAINEAALFTDRLKAQKVLVKNLMDIDDSLAAYIRVTVQYTKEMAAVVQKIENFLLEKEY